MVRIPSSRAATVTWAGSVPRRRARGGGDGGGIGPAQAGEAEGEPAADEPDQAMPQDLVLLPELGIADPVDILPELIEAHPGLPQLAQVSDVEARHAGRQPRFRMDAIRDMPDRHLALLPAWPNGLPHPAG